MNKIKLMYDIVNAMKEKEVFKGQLKVEGTKNGNRLFGFENIFEKNCTTGSTNAKTLTEINAEGKRVRMEHSLDMEAPACEGHSAFFRHFHGPHGLGHRQAHSFHKGGIREGLSKLAFILGIFNSIQVEEQADKSIVMTLSLSDIPEEIKKAHQEHVKQMTECHKEMENCHHHAFAQEFRDLEKADLKVTLWVNAKHEVEKASAAIDGEKKNDSGETAVMQLRANLAFSA